MEECAGSDTHIRHNLSRETTAWVKPLIKLFVNIFPGHLILHSAHLFHMAPVIMATFMTTTMVTIVVHLRLLGLARGVLRFEIAKI